MELNTYNYSTKKERMFQRNMAEKPNSDWTLRLKTNASTYDTIAWILNVAKQTKGQQSITDALNYSNSPDTYQWAKNLFDFVSKRVEYVTDTVGEEDLTTPDRLLRDAKGDCKKMTVFIAAAAMRAGVPVYFKVIDYGQGDGWEHIYPIIPLADGTYITMDVVNHKRFNEEIPHEKEVIYNEKGEKVNLNLMGAREGQRTGYGTAAATGAEIGAGRTTGYGTAAATGASIGHRIANDCDDLLMMCEGRVPVRHDYRRGNNQMGALGALFKMNLAGWEKIAGHPDSGNWAALMPLFLDYKSLPERLKPKYDELAEYVRNNTKKDLSLTAAMIGISRGIKNVKEKTPQQLLADLNQGANAAQISGGNHLGDMFDDLENIVDSTNKETGVVEVDITQVVYDSIAGTQTGTDIEGFLSKGLSWITGLFKDKAITGKNSLQKVHPGIVFTVEDYAEIFYNSAAAPIPNLGVTGVLADLTTQFWFKDDKGTWHKFSTLPHSNTDPQKVRGSALDVTTLTLIGEQLGFGLLNFTPKGTSVSPVGEPIPMATVAQGVSFINANGGIQQPLQGAIVIPPGMSDIPNDPVDINKPQPTTAGTDLTKLALPAAAAYLLFAG